MLYQDKPSPLRLQLRLKGDGLMVDALLCHVNLETRFTVRERETFEVETAGEDWREVEFTINSERPLRSIQLTLRPRRGTGR